uniref:Uncharacterized protein n=1 Tax=Oryza brachyantha TaxID=4533 RepID=J3LVI3_ORYBR
MDDERILLVAHDMLHITKDAFIDNMSYEDDVNKEEIIRPEAWSENEIPYDRCGRHGALSCSTFSTPSSGVRKVGLQQPDVLITYILQASTVC